MSDIEARAEKQLTKPYPGRVITAGMTGRGDIRFHYAIMGRSPRSSQRILERREDGIWTAHSIPKEQTDDPDVYYKATHQDESGRFVGVSNGVQTTKIVEALAAGVTMGQALLDWKYESDGVTPRIVMVFDRRLEALYVGKVAKNPFDSTSVHSSYSMSVYRGEGWGICTYTGEGIDPLQAYNEEPFPYPIRDTLARGGRRFWTTLNSANRVASFSQQFNGQTGQVTHGRIYNARRGD